MAFGETNIPFWQESGHSCRECTVTGLRFWSRDPSRTTSGDTVEDSYTFIGNPIIEGFPMRGKALKDAMRINLKNLPYGAIETVIKRR